jgi:threonine dehydrogenase-like Zn-dependent dehydrogenase
VIAGGPVVPAARVAGRLQVQDDLGVPVGPACRTCRRRRLPGRAKSRATRQAHVRRWTGDLMPIVTDDSDPLGIQQLATHHLPLEDAPHGYQIFRDKTEGCIKVILHP